MNGYDQQTRRFKIDNFFYSTSIVMAHGAQERVQNSIRDFVNHVDKSHLREVERQMHLCAADCCTNKEASINDMLACKDKCEIPAKKAQQYLQSELERFQESLNRCVLSCQDDIKDKMTPNTSEADMEKYKYEFDSCAIKCCDTNIAKLPNLSKRVMDALKSGQI